LGILAAIAIPRFAGIQDQAKIDADAATAKSIVSAARIFDAQENDTLSATNDNLPTALFDISVSPQTGGTFELGTSGEFYTVTFGEGRIHQYSEETSEVTTTTTP